MKRHIIHAIALTTLTASLGLVSCSSEKANDSTEIAESVNKADDFQVINPEYQTAESFMTTFKDVAYSYIDVKNALVKSNATEVKAAAVDMVDKLDNIDEANLNGEILQYWEENKDQLKKAGSKISETDDLATMREQFTELSKHMIKLVKTYGVSGNTFYEQYCPMANNDKGGSWLSLETEIKNPYYGDAMLKCGELKSEIQ